jgi:chromosome segregation ATPase
MSDKINAFFQLLEARIGLHPTGVAAIALVIVLALALLSLFLIAKLRSAREVIQQLGKRLGYDPPYGDGVEIVDEEIRKDVVLQGKEVTIRQLEQLVADLENEAKSKDANLSALQQRLKALDEQLQKAALWNNELTAQASEQAQAHRKAVEQLEQHIRDMEAQRDANLAALQRHSKELEEQLQQASLWNNELTAQASEQAQAHRKAVEQLEQHIRDMEAQRDANLAALQRHSKELEEQLQQASLRNNELTAQASEQAQFHRAAVEQFEQRIHDMETEHVVNLRGLQQRWNELEDQLQQATIQNDQLTAQAGEQAQAHRATVEQLEQRIREMEAGSNNNLAALQQRSKELEDQLEQETIQNENENSIAHQEALERNANIEQLELRIRDLETEKDAADSRLTTLQTRVKELEDQLQQAAGQATATEGKVAADTSELLLRRAEWITACSVGAIRPLGLVAAEAYAAAAIAADPQNSVAPQLLVELAKLRRASRESFPSVVEAVTTFDEGAAGFFGADLARAVDIAEREALQRYQAGLNRSALLVLNLSLALRQQTAAEDSPGALKLQEMKASLLARLGSNAEHA